MEIIASKADLRHACKTWSGSEDLFRQILIAYLTQWGAYQRDLARELGMAESTIARWVSGASRPHPAFQAVVIARIGQKAEADASHKSYKFKAAIPAALERRPALRKPFKNTSHQKKRAKA